MRKSENAGFGLVEALVAMAIAMLVVSVLADIISMSNRGVNSVRRVAAITSAVNTLRLAMSDQDRCTAIITESVRNIDVNVIPSGNQALATAVFQFPGGPALFPPPEASGGATATVSLLTLMRTNVYRDADSDGTDDGAAERFDEYLGNFQLTGMVGANQFIGTGRSTNNFGAILQVTAGCTVGCQIQFCRSDGGGMLEQTCRMFNGVYYAGGTDAEFPDGVCLPRRLALGTATSYAEAVNLYRFGSTAIPAGTATFPEGVLSIDRMIHYRPLIDVEYNQLKVGPGGTTVNGSLYLCDPGATATNCRGGT